MKLWVLKRKFGSHTGHDEYYGFVIRAESTEAAYQLACSHAAIQQVKNYGYDIADREEWDIGSVTEDGPAEIILENYVEG